MASLVFVRCLSWMKFSLSETFFFLLFLGCTALRDGLSNMYHAAYIQGTLQKEEPISPHCSAVVFTCVPCHVPGCIWRILTRQKTSVSRVPITLLQETSVADENSFYSCTTVIILFSRLIKIVENVNPFAWTARSCCLPSGQGTLLVISFSLIWWMDEEIFPLSSGFELLILQVPQSGGYTILHLLVKILSKSIERFACKVYG